MGEDTWDLVVIGTGGAAMAAGIEARARGKQVLLIEHGQVGGACLNIGCVPSKNLLAAAGQRHRAASNSSFPMVPTSAGGVDLPALMGQKQDLIDGLRQAKYLDVADAQGFPIRRGNARFVDGQTLEVDGERIVGVAYVVATGAAPHVPDLPGLDAVDWLTSTTAMEQRSLPASMVVLGGGYVGLEQAQLWAHLGVQVTLVGRFAPHVEPEIADVLRGVFADDGIAVVEERGQAVEPTADGGVLVRTSSGQEVTADRLLIAAGRFPDTGDLGLQAAGVQTDERGFVTVDDRQRTSNPRVCSPRGTSPARRSTCTSPHRPAAPPRSTPSAARTGSTTPACPASRSRRRRSPQPGSPRSRRWPPGTTATAGCWTARTSRGRWPTATPVARRDVRHQAGHDSGRRRRHLGPVPDHERGPADRGRTVSKRQAHQLLRMTGDRPRNGRWWPLLALPVLCCVGHAVLIAVGVGTLTAVTGGMTGSVAVAAVGLLLVAAAAVVLIRHRWPRPAPLPTTPPALPEPSTEEPRDPDLADRPRARPSRRLPRHQAMEPVSAWMYEPESQAARDWEDAVRPGPPYRIAAQKTTGLLGLELSEAALGKAALVVHHGLAVSWAPTYALLLRRRTRLGPVAAGLASSAAMSALVDEGLTPALGFSAPNRAYPAAAHVRGVVAHLAFGLAVAAVTEAGWGMLRRRP